MTALVRLGKTRDRVVLVQEVCTHDVPFGENFLVQAVMVFRKVPDHGGAVLFEKFCCVRWVASLPFMARWMKPLIESKSKEGAREAAVKLADYFESLAPKKA